MEIIGLLDDDEDGGRRSERSEVGGRRSKDGERSEELGLASPCPCWRGWARRVADDQAACVGDDVPALLVLGHPGAGVDERVRGVLRRLAAVGDDAHRGGVDAAARVGARPVVGVLQIHHRVWNVAVAPVPLHPAGEVDDGAEEGLHEDDVGVFLPWAAEEGLHPTGVCALVGGDRTVLEGESRSVQGVATPLCGDHVVSAGLAGTGAANQ